MSLMRQTFLPTLARSLLAVVLVCALLVAQLGLTHHVVEHASNPVVAAATLSDHSDVPQAGGCLSCLEFQAHGAGLISQSHSIATAAVRVFELRALAPNTPYLAPERASQRAPPVLS